MPPVLGAFAAIISGAGCKHRLLSFSLELVRASSKSLITARYCSGVCFYFCVLHFLLLSDPSLPTLTVLFCFIIPANLQPACVAEGGAEEEPSRGTAAGSCKTARLQMNADLHQHGATHVKENSPESTRETAALPVQPGGSPPPGSPSFGTAPCPPLSGVLGGERWVLRAPRPGTPVRAVPVGTWGQPHTLGEEAPSPLPCSAL